MENKKLIRKKSRRKLSTLAEVTCTTKNMKQNVSQENAYKEINQSLRGERHDKDQD